MLIDPSKNIPTSTATSSEWINWYKAMNAYFTQQECNYLFLKAWKVRSSDSANDDKLRAFLKSKGVEIDADFTDFEWVKNPGGIFDWFKTAANTAFWIGGLILVAVFLVAYRISKNTKLNIPVI